MFFAAAQVVDCGGVCANAIVVLRCSLLIFRISTLVKLWSKTIFLQSTSDFVWIHSILLVKSQRRAVGTKIDKKNRANKVSSTFERRRGWADRSAYCLALTTKQTIQAAEAIHQNKSQKFEQSIYYLTPMRKTQASRLIRADWKRTKAFNNKNSFQILPKVVVQWCFCVTSLVPANEAASPCMLLSHQYLLLWNICTNTIVIIIHVHVATVDPEFWPVGTATSQ